MFEVNGVYANRRGRYTVLAVNPPKMKVRYDDGTVADLKIDLQERIWENIAVEFQAQEASRQARAARRRPASNENSYFIKVISVLTTDEMAFPGWTEQVVLEPQPHQDVKVKFGDRLIFYAIESRTFFAVATITGELKKANPKKYFYNLDMKKAGFFAIDIDASVDDLNKGAEVEFIELETQPKFKNLRLEAETYLEINEDDFELLAELLTEVVEDDDDEDDDIDEVVDEDTFIEDSID
ncbi:MAG: EVE domain-containing protein [Chloroflexi bacterium]|nr:MAG: EVE domain-containing protein [Chloroflexota bacterium]